MPKCKNCQREITKNDYDICPYCGEKNPIPTNYETMDVTSVVARIGTQELPRTRKTNIFRLLAVLVGLFGVHWFYIYRPKWGYITLTTTLLGTAAFGTAFYFACWQNWLIYLLVLGGFWLFHLVYGLAYGSIDNLKDGRGGVPSLMQHYIGTIDEGYVTLSEADAHHLLNVKRAEKGENIEVSDEGKTYLCIVESLSPLRISVVEERADDRELTGEVAIAFGLLKADHNELIVQKGTELGVRRFLPFTSSRTIVKPNGKEDPKLLRLRKIAFESTKQCRRANVPEVEGYSRYQEILNLDYDYRFFAFEGEAIHGLPFFKALHELPSLEGKRIIVLIGPEGGFSDKEAEEAVNAGFVPVSLGKRILRAETAAIYSATLLSAFLEKGE